MPHTRLHTVFDGLLGELAMTMSPTLTCRSLGVMASKNTAGFFVLSRRLHELASIWSNSRGLSYPSPNPAWERKLVC